MGLYSKRLRVRSVGKGSYKCWDHVSNSGPSGDAEKREREISDGRFYTSARRDESPACKTATKGLRRCL